MKTLILFLFGSLAGASLISAQINEKRADLHSEELTRYFENRVALLEDPLADVTTLEQWQELQPVLREQLFDMMGLSPRPERTPLKPVITGTVEREDFTVEKLHFQSRPQLYVTANLYLPKGSDGPFPTILYVCGHAKVKEGGYSYGNKVGYHHHGVWFARNGYACLTIDTLQLGEIEGIHHGTYNQGRWWWLSRGYTSAGVEAWNAIRALDYLETRPEVDAERIGVTGRSGGGAYSWWAATMDDRIKAAVPVAGITTLRNHIVHGCIEGHCDCMFPVNTYAWDFSKVSSLVAPRPLLISNTDKDSIFPLDGVTEIYFQTRDIYALHDARNQLGLDIEEGPHKDVQPLRVSAFHWFNRHLKGATNTDTFEMAATKIFEPEDLRVFDEIPADEINTKIDEVFVPKAAPPQVPESQSAWQQHASGLREQLMEKSFRGWPEDEVTIVREIAEAEAEGITLRQFEVTTAKHVTCHLYVVSRTGLPMEELDLMVLNIMGEEDWRSFQGHIPQLFPEVFEGIEDVERNQEQIDAELEMHQNFKWGMSYFFPRGVGPGQWTEDEIKFTHTRRRFALVGQTLDGMRTYDILQMLNLERDGTVLPDVPVWLQAGGNMAGNALYGSILAEEPVQRLDLHDLPLSHRQGPTFLNVMRFMDMPEAVAMAAERASLRIYTDNEEAWQFSMETAEALEWGEKAIELRKPTGD